MEKIIPYLGKSLYNEKSLSHILSCVLNGYAKLSATKDIIERIEDHGLDTVRTALDRTISLETVLSEMMLHTSGDALRSKDEAILLARMKQTLGDDSYITNTYQELLTLHAEHLRIATTLSESIGYLNWHLYHSREDIAIGMHTFDESPEMKKATIDKAHESRTSHHLRCMYDACKKLLSQHNPLKLVEIESRREQRTQQGYITNQGFGIDIITHESLMFRPSYIKQYESILM